MPSSISATHSSQLGSVPEQATAALTPETMRDVFGSMPDHRSQCIISCLMPWIMTVAVRAALTRPESFAETAVRAAVDHATGTILGQVGIGMKTNEITRIEVLLNIRKDVAGVVVTMDALHAQR